MAIYRVLQKWQNEETEEVYEKGHEIELTVKRAEQAIENLKKHKGEFLERLDDPAEEVKGKQEKQGKGK